MDISRTLYFESGESPIRWKSKKTRSYDGAYYGGSIRIQAFLDDLPIGRYNLKVEMIDEVDRLPLTIKQPYSSARDVETVQIDFKLSSSYATFLILLVSNDSMS